MLTKAKQVCPAGVFFHRRKYYLQVTGIRRLLPQTVSSTGGLQKLGPADLLKTISMGLIADGLIFKGLIGPFLLVIGYSAITSGE